MKPIKTIADLIPDDKNVNKGTERGTGLLEKSLRKYGAGRSILVDKNGRVIAGNKTIEQAAAIGLEKITEVRTSGNEIVAVRRMDVDLNTKRGQEMAIADNRVGQVNLDWDEEILKSLDVDLSQFWNENELKKLGIEVPTLEAPEPQLDKAAGLQAKWKTERGQIWEIGRHRLMCGSSTDELAVKALMSGHGAALLATDPPYGVGYGVTSGPDSARRFDPIDNDGDDGPKLQSFLESVFTVALPHLASGCAWYLWHAQMTQGFFAAAAAAAAAAQVKIHRQIVWAKSHFILGHGDYHWQHELCFYGWREGEKHRWFGGRDQSTLWQIPNPKAHENHPTEKPPELFARAMVCSTEPGEVVYEPFSGSGSQLCAAQNLDRICYAMEIEPKYVAVALERMADMGLRPKLFNKLSVKSTKEARNGKSTPKSKRLSKVETGTERQCKGPAEEAYRSAGSTA